MNAGCHWDYTVADLRQIAADHNLRPTMRMTHDQLVELITVAGIQLPPKPLERMPPFRGRRGPLAVRDLHLSRSPVTRWPGFRPSPSEGQPSSSSSVSPC